MAITICRNQNTKLTDGDKVVRKPPFTQAVVTTQTDFILMMSSHFGDQYVIAL